MHARRLLSKFLTFCLGSPVGSQLAHAWDFFQSLLLFSPRESSFEERVYSLALLCASTVAVVGPKTGNYLLMLLRFDQKRLISSSSLFIWISILFLSSNPRFLIDVCLFFLYPFFLHFLNTIQRDHLLPTAPVCFCQMQIAPSVLRILLRPGKS